MKHQIIITAEQLVEGGGISLEVKDSGNLGPFQGALLCLEAQKAYTEKAQALFLASVERAGGAKIPVRIARQ